MTPTLPVVHVFRGSTGVCILACGPPAGVVMGAEGGDFFQAALKGRAVLGLPRLLVVGELAGSRS